MAKNLYFTCEVCERIARGLVTEQAELLKHEVLVKEMKGKLVEGKQQLIKQLISGRTFRVEGKKMTALEILFDEKDGKMLVHIELGLDADSEVTPCVLSRKESQLLKEYRNCLMLYRNGLEYMGQDALETARRLSCLKNHIRLTRCYCWLIDINNATTPGFFKESGLTTGGFVGVGTKQEMLEDVRINSL